MSKHWRPDSNVVPLDPARERRDWRKAGAYRASPAARRRSIGFPLLVIAVAILGGGAVGAYQALAWPERLASAPAPVHFTSCKWGGGTNCVVDGDTFYIGGEKVRIAGIDAPETHDYRCGEELALGNEATDKLQSLLNSGAVTMTSIDRDRDTYGRLLRNVAVNGADVGQTMVSAGVARAYAGGRRPWC